MYVWSTKTTKELILIRRLFTGTISKDDVYEMKPKILVVQSDRSPFRSHPSLSTLRFLLQTPSNSTTPNLNNGRR